MKRRQTPRPELDKPTVITSTNVSKHLWGDEEAGFVADRIFASSDKIHQLEIQMPPNSGFYHSENNRTIFAADEVFVVVEGTLVIANPESGEVHLVEQGNSALFHRDTWHHGLNYGKGTLRVIEYFSPPPAQGTASQYAKLQNYLDTSKYTRDNLLENWPNPQINEARSFTIIRDTDLLWRLEGELNKILVGIIASTPNLTVAKIKLLPSQKGSPRRHGGDLCLYVLEGVLNVLITEAESNSWLEINSSEGCFIPEGVEYQFFNMTGNECLFIMGVAPTYLSNL